MKILIAQARPDMEKSPYNELVRKYNVELTFFPFIRLEPMEIRDIRKQKIDFSIFTAIIFTSRNAIDHFFHGCEEMKITVPPETRYYCITESIALYLQKFITYRKRRISYGLDGTNQSLFDAILRNKEKENFLYVCSEDQQDNEIVNWLRNNEYTFQLAFMYRSVSNDLHEVLDNKKYDVICLFTPSGVKSLLENFPNFRKNGSLIAAFGNNTMKAIESAGLEVTIKAPVPMAPSMVSALDLFFASKLKKV